MQKAFRNFSGRLFLFETYFYHIFITFFPYFFHGFSIECIVGCLARQAAGHAANLILQTLQIRGQTQKTGGRKIDRSEGSDKEVWGSHRSGPSVVSYR